MKFPDIGAFFQLPNTAIRQVSYGILIGFTLSLSATSITHYFSERRRQERLEKQTSLRPIELRSDEIVRGVTGLIGVSLFLSTMVTVEGCQRIYCSMGQEIRRW
jgi:cysteine synthase A